MKRIEQLRPLSREHHLSLVLANKAIKVAKSADVDEISQLCQQIASDFDERWNSHFQKEEQTIFPILEEKYADKLIGDMTKITTLLRQQHDEMRNMAEAMRIGNVVNLDQFGQLLKEHTRLEERELFPLISDLFSKTELDRIFSAL